jgi:hypothetical protein
MLYSLCSHRGGGRKEGEMNVKELKMLVALGEYDKANAGPSIDYGVLKQQIGMGNLLAISGGRKIVFKSTVFLPVARGYYVAVSLTSADDYKVSRLFLRSGKVSVKESFEGVYAENVGEVSYRASCFENA